jgi:hypothetical protein
MKRELLIKKTIENLDKLPDHKLQEVSDFAEFLLKSIDDQILAEGMQKLTAESEAFRFLEDEEDLYSQEDIKERFK